MVGTSAPPLANQEIHPRIRKKKTKTRPKATGPEPSNNDTEEAQRSLQSGYATFQVERHPVGTHEDVGSSEPPGRSATRADPAVAAQPPPAAADPVIDPLLAQPPPAAADPVIDPLLLAVLQPSAALSAVQTPRNIVAATVSPDGPNVGLPQAHAKRLAKRREQQPTPTPEVLTPAMTPTQNAAQANLSPNGALETPPECLPKPRQKRRVQQPTPARTPEPAANIRTPASSSPVPNIGMNPTVPASANRRHQTADLLAAAEASKYGAQASKRPRKATQRTG